MSKHLLAATLVAAALVACERQPTTPPPRRAVVRPVAVVAPEPPRVTAVQEPEPLAPQLDAGLDALALAHDAPAVDHLARARQLKADGEPRGALTEVRRALFTTPDDEEALELAGRLARLVGQPALAAEAWGRLGARRPDDALPLIQQARALHAAKDYPGAVIAGREALARDAENAEASQVVGLAQLAMGELAGAIASFERAVEIEPDHGWALNNLGFAYLRANQNEKAVVVLERAAEKLPHVAFVQNNLGVALERTGRNEEARAAYQHAMDLSPKYVKARINAARVASTGTPDEPDDGADSLSDVPHPMPQPLKAE